MKKLLLILALLLTARLAYTQETTPILDFHGPTIPPPPDDGLEWFS